MAGKHRLCSYSVPSMMLNVGSRLLSKRSKRCRMLALMIY